MRVRSLLVVVVVAALFAAPALAKKKLLEGIPLEWHPTTELGELSPVSLTGLSGVKIQVGEFTDGREEKRLIAENREDDEPLPVTTRDDVPGWIAGRVQVLLGDFGFDTVESGGTVVLTAEVRRFFIRETGVYEGDVLLRVKAARPDGKVLWEGMTGGAATRFGRSYKAENYYEVFSDSILEATHKLVQNEEFRASLAGKP